MNNILIWKIEIFGECKELTKLLVLLNASTIDACSTSLGLIIFYFTQFNLFKYIQKQQILGQKKNAI